MKVLIEKHPALMESGDPGETSALDGDDTGNRNISLFSLKSVN